MEKYKKEINTINKFLSETQPNKKIKIANTIKNSGIYGLDKYNKIIKQESICLSGRTFVYNKDKNKYILAN